MRNSSLVKRFCAENVTGLKHSTEATDSDDFVIAMVGERSVRRYKIDREDNFRPAEVRMSA